MKNSNELDSAYSLKMLSSLTDEELKKAINYLESFFTDIERDDMKQMAQAIINERREMDMAIKEMNEKGSL